MNKKLIISMTTLCICLSFTVCTYAYTPDKISGKNVNNNPEVHVDPLYKTERNITESEIFIPNEPNNNGNNTVVPNVIVPSFYGQVRIDTSNSGDSGISNTDTKSGYWSTIQYLIMKLLPYIPGVGISHTRLYTAGNGYSPTTIQKAPHYDDKTGLANIFNEHWANGQPAYYETY